MNLDQAKEQPMSNITTDLSLLSADTIARDANGNPIGTPEEIARYEASLVEDRNAPVQPGQWRTR